MLLLVVILILILNRKEQTVLSKQIKATMVMLLKDVGNDITEAGEKLFYFGLPSK